MILIRFWPNWLKFIITFSYFIIFIWFLFYVFIKLLNTIGVIFINFGCYLLVLWLLLLLAYFFISFSYFIIFIQFLFLYLYKTINSLWYEFHKIWLLFACSFCYSWLFSILSIGFDDPTKLWVFLCSMLSVSNKASSLIIST